MQTALAILVLTFVAMSNSRSLKARSTSDSAALQFPRIKFDYKQEVVLKSRKWDTVLAVLANQGGSPRLVTRSLQSTEDQDAHFMMYFFTTAEPNETKLVLPFHEATGSYLSMTDDKKLVLKQSTDENSVDLMASATMNAKSINVADDRFFYFKNSGNGESDNVFEAMNGKQSDYYVSVPGEHEDPELRHVPKNHPFPGQIVFQVVDPHDVD